MEKKKNEMGYWLIFILILMTISISIILYFRLPKSINKTKKEDVTVTKEVYVVE